MERKTMLYSVRAAVVAVIFSAGYLAGSLNQPTAHAQMNDLGGQMMQKAVGSSGGVGNVTKLGSTITDLEKNVSGLQKNIDVLKQIQGALGGK